MNNFIKNAIKWLIFALPAVALVVPTYMFFPFITGKAFLFRLAVELAFCLYVALAISDSSYRPKWNPLMISFAAFVVVMFVADIFAISPVRAFWSNFERMDGFVTLIHLFMYFVAASSVLRSKKDWRIWMYSATAVSVYLTLFCFLQLVGEAKINQGAVRVDGSLGNAAYLGAYMLFHIFFLAYLWISEEVEFVGVGVASAVGGVAYSLYYVIRIAQDGVAHTTAGIIILSSALILSLASLLLISSKKLCQKYGKIVANILYAIIASSYLVVLYHTATRGAILGLIGGVAIAALYLLFKNRNSKKAKVLSVVSLAVIVVGAGVFYGFRNSSFVQNSPVLSRFASISLSEASGQARGYVWPMAIQGFKEHPVLGWGQEGFNYVFQKYYVPEMITQEPFFDRAHNSFLDWLVAGGVLGFLSYLALYIAALYMVWKSASLSAKEKAILLGLIAAYTFQNIFIFDNLTSYIFFVSLLALISARANSVVEEHKSEKVNMSLVVSCIAAFILIAYAFNAKGYMQNTTLVQGIQKQNDGITQNLALIKKAIAYNSFGTLESREQLIQIASQVVSSGSLPDEPKIAFANAVVDELSKQIADNPPDVRVNLEYGDFLINVGAYDQAIPILEKAEAVSPKKQQVLFTLAKAYLAKGSQLKDKKDLDTAVEIAKSAYDLLPNSDAVRIPYISVLLVSNRIKEAAEIIKDVQSTEPLVNSPVISALASNNLSDVAITLLGKAIVNNNQNSDAYILLSNVYVYKGDKVNAVKALEDMVSAIPSLKAEGEKDIAAVKLHFGQK